MIDFRTPPFMLSFCFTNLGSTGKGNFSLLEIDFCMKRASGVEHEKEEADLKLEQEEEDGEEDSNMSMSM